MAFLCGATACSDDLPPIRYETEQALIGTSDSTPLCGWDLAAIDSHISFVEEVLDAESAEKVDIYLYDELPPDCRGVGCYKEEGYVLATWLSYEHEVVHAVVDRFADPPLFLSEGIAEALTERGTERGSTTVAENLEVTDAADLSYSTAGHFMRWLIEDRGGFEPARALLSGGDPRSIHGASLVRLGEEYEVEAPHYYPPWSSCDQPSLLEVGEEHWRETIDVECERADVSRLGEAAVSLWRSVELGGGRYELRVEGGKGARLLGCEPDILEDPPAEMAFGDTNSEAEYERTARGILFESGTTHTIELIEGTYRIDVPVFEAGERVDIELRGLSPARTGP